MSLHVQVLGSFEVRLDHQPIGPAGAKRRGLLALLALRANRPVPVADLIDGLWGDAAPPTAVNIVQTYVSAWRKALEPVRSHRTASRLSTAGSSYRLALKTEEFDLSQLEQAEQNARQCEANADYASAAGILRDALALCVGPPLADLADLPFHAGAATRLDELRLGVLERWAAAELKEGLAHEVVPVLRIECDQHPLRERLTELLMWALWQDDRQDEALNAYETLRRHLVDDLGVDPCPGVRDMHARVLRQDPTLKPIRRATRRRELVLPLLTDSFIGRADEVTRVQRLLAGGRLVTLTGPGGSGKTRLAIEVARLAASSGSHVAFVDCAPLVDAGRIPDRVAAALRVRPNPGESPLAAIARAIERTSSILVLDNLEQLPDAAAVVVDLLGAAVQLRVLATARGPLHARGEQLFPVPPLAVEDRPTATSSPAIALFADRAAALDAGFVLTPERVEQVRTVCRRLDGLPLAIELAASRLRLLPLAALVERLDRALDLLEAEPGDRPLRHRALRATVQSSYDLLTDKVRVTFQAMSVFRGGWDLAAAATVAGAADEIDILRDTGALLDAGLIERLDHHDRSRFRMLETLREFAEEQLRSRGEQLTARGRHAHHFVGLARQACPHLLETSRNQWFDRLEDDRDNLATAFSWMVAAGQAGAAAPAAAGLWRFWQARGHLEEGRLILHALLERIVDSDDAILRADLLNALGSLAYYQREWATARHLYSEALESYEVARAWTGVADARYNLGFIAVMEGAIDQARWYFTKARTGYRRASKTEGVANAEAGLAVVDRMTGAYQQARRRATRSLEEQHRLGNDLEADNTLGLLGSIEACMGNPDEAETLLRRALVAHHEAGNIFGVIWMLHELAAVAARRGLPQRALRLSCAAHTFETRAGGGIGIEQLGLTRPLDDAASRLTPEAAGQARDEGERFTIDQAVASALGLA